MKEWAVIYITNGFNSMTIKKGPVSRSFCFFKSCGFVAYCFQSPFDRLQLRIFFKV